MNLTYMSWLILPLCALHVCAQDKQNWDTLIAKQPASRGVIPTGKIVFLQSHLNHKNKAISLQGDHLIKNG